MKVQDAERAADRFLLHRRREEVFALIAVILFAIVTFGGYLGYRRQADIRDTTHKVECIARITAEFQAAVADAFITPPAPNAARTEAVARIEASSRKLKNLDRYCPA